MTWRRIVRQPWLWLAIAAVVGLGIGGILSLTETGHDRREVSHVTADPSDSPAPRLSSRPAPGTRGPSLTPGTARSPESSTAARPVSPSTAASAATPESEVPVAGATTSAPATVEPELTARALILLVSERADADAGELARYPGMDAAAQEWSEEMARTDTLAHRPRLAPYSGEVIASGSPSADAAVQLWMSSPAYRDILDPSFTKVGIGYRNGYWTAVLS
ncbi:CAP domain-containing protein [Streptomyces sp. NPDC126514]|uniref:CAP domain-containing protein n=1 Tax=Streptomyces sp. NPDC126514 TaxID=3155210 RepID=UPI0033225311